MNCRLAAYFRSVVLKFALFKDAFEALDCSSARVNLTITEQFPPNAVLIQREEFNGDLFVSVVIHEDGAEGELGGVHRLTIHFPS